MPPELITAQVIADIRQNYAPPWAVYGGRTIYRLLDEIERLNAKLEQADGELGKRLTLQPWDEVKDDLVGVYRGTAVSVEEGVKAVYGCIQDMLVLDMVLARAALAGDE